jgi:hypothetical protein
MMAQKIERVDTIPLVIAILKNTSPIAWPHRSTATIFTYTGKNQRSDAAVDHCPSSADHDGIRFAQGAIQKG